MSKYRGLTFLEVLVVLAIIGILATIAVPNFRISIIKTREAVLRENLYQIRDAIHKYYQDKQRYPAELEELVAARYLREIPKDPVTRKREWNIVYFDPENLSLYGDDQLNGIVDVKSMSDGAATDGTRYRDW